MKKIIMYAFIYEVYLEKLVINVRKSMEDGWQPLGGVCEGGGGLY